MVRIGVLGSTRGSALAVLMEAVAQKTLDASIELIITDRYKAPIRERARAQRVPDLFLSAKGLTREAFDRRVCEALESYRVDLVLLVGYMRIVSPYFVQRWQRRVMNIHPSLLPKYAGLMDLAVHQAVLASGDQHTGCSVHYVDDTVDGGPIVLQRQCEVLAGDTPEQLKQRVQALEREALLAAVNVFASSETFLEK
jgi:phosphoribosylglycinamide formyltransferase-1